MDRNSIQECKEALSDEHMSKASVLAQLAIAEQLERIANAMWTRLEKKEK